jgi:hypothetical protein
MLGPWKAKILVYETGKGALYALFFCCLRSVKKPAGAKRARYFYVLSLEYG